MTLAVETRVKGFSMCGASAGLKPDGAHDVALLVSDRPCAAAAVFTRNRVKAAPVRYDQAVLRRAPRAVRAVAINSKNANACTGRQGMRDAARMAAVARDALGLSASDEVLVMSTGVIGVPMPMARIEQGIRAGAGSLMADGVDAAARAIMTTDTYPKTATVRMPDGVTLVGIAKGAGMIHPDMATMLSVVITDAALEPDALGAALRHAVDRSFHCISVDGDTSTNDTCAVLANGASGVTPDREAFQDALTALMQDLARQIAFDGEGATKRVTIRVDEAPSQEAARRVGRTIATSPLVKTAIYGRDANWGRVLAAAGRAGVRFHPDRSALWFGDLQVLDRGTPLPFDEARALAILSEPDLDIRLDLGSGPASATVWTCDFSHDYVTINGAYRT